MAENNEPNISIPKDKKATVVLKKSKLSTYNDHIWVVIRCHNLIGLNPGTMIPEQDIINLHAIPDLDVMLISNLEEPVHT